MIKSPTGHLRLKGTKEADPLIQSKKVSHTKRAGGVLLTSHFSDQQREGGGRGGGSLLTPHRGASSVSKLLNRLLQEEEEEEGKEEEADCFKNLFKTEFSELFVFNKTQKQKDVNK